MTVSFSPAVAVARGAGYLFANRVANSVISVAAFAIIARVISRDDMGVLAVLVLVVAATQVFAGLGLGSAATKFVSSYSASREDDKVRAAGYSCLLLNGIGVVLISGGLFFAADTISVLLFGSANRAALLRLLIPEIAAVGLSYSLTGVLYGLKRFKQVSVTDMATFAVRQGLVVALLELGYGLPGMVIAWGIGDSLSSIILAAYTVSSLGPLRVNFRLIGFPKFSAPLFASELATFVWTNFDRAILVPLVSLAQLGAYNVALTAYSLLNALPLSISGTLFPYYAHLYTNEEGRTEEDKRVLQNAIKTASRYVSLLTIPISVGLAVTAFPAMTLLAGNIYADAAYPLAILSIYLALACQARALGQVFVVLGRTLTSATVTIGSMLVPLAIGILAVSRFGIVGAALARGLSLVVVLVFSIVLLRRTLRVELDMKAYAFAWLSSLVMAAVILPLEQAFYNKYFLPVYVTIGGLAFLLALRMTRVIKRTDLRLVDEFLGPRYRFLTRILRTLFGIKPTTHV